MSERLDTVLNNLPKFSGTLRQVQILIKGSSLLRPNGQDIANALAYEGWNISNVRIVGSYVLSGYLRDLDVLVTANVESKYSDTDIVNNARNIVSRFVDISNVQIVKGIIPEYTTPERAREASTGDSWAVGLGGLGAGISLPFALAFVGLILYFGRSRR